MVFIYDGSFEGLLSCIFIAFKERQTPRVITAVDMYQTSLLEISRSVQTNEADAARVLKGVDERTKNRASGLLYKLFLSELPGSDMLAYSLVYEIVRQRSGSVLSNYANPHVLKAVQIEKMISREVHRMHAFVRFQKSSEGLFYAVIEPDFNVLPLIGDHFERRYADQPWLIFDTKRHYGLYYDKQSMAFVSSEDPVCNIAVGLVDEADFQDERETTYQALWKNYFHSVNIAQRNNAKLHLRHMPKRYWKYLTEKI